MPISLRDYQLKAISDLNNGCILCGGVGSGKSLTALGYYFSRECGADIHRMGELPEMQTPKDLYIITTARKRDTFEWDKDMAHLRLSQTEDACAYPVKVAVDSWNNIGKYVDVHDAFFIFDEQRLVGSGAWVKAFYKIAKKNRWILLSATPGDTWIDYVPVFVANGFYSNKTEFTCKHVIYSRFSKYPKIDKYYNVDKLIRLRNSILVDMDFHRETISHHEDVFVKHDVTKYREVQKNRWDIWKDQPFRNASELCYALRRVVNSDDSRQIALIELFEKHPKMIVFYNFDYELDILKHLYYGEDVVVAEWNGHRHEAVPDGDSWVYLVQYNAGAEGWNCITTDTIVFYSQNYSYKVMRQSAGRIDRLNTPYTDLYYYHLRSRSGIDLAISRALKEKKNFNEGKFTKW